MHAHGFIVAQLSAKGLVALRQLQIHLLHACCKCTVGLLQRVRGLIKTSERGVQQLLFIRMIGCGTRHSPSDDPVRCAVFKLVLRDEERRLNIESPVASNLLSICSTRAVSAL